MQHHSVFISSWKRSPQAVRIDKKGSRKQGDWAGTRFWGEREGIGCHSSVLVKAVWWSSRLNWHSRYCQDGANLVSRVVGHLKTKSGNRRWENPVLWGWSWLTLRVHISVQQLFLHWGTLSRLFSECLLDSVHLAVGLQTLVCQLVREQGYCQASLILDLLIHSLWLRQCSLERTTDFLKTTLVPFSHNFFISSKDTCFKWWIMGTALEFNWRAEQI